MTKKNIAIIFGGCSGEYLVSLASASTVLAHTDITKYNITPVGITRSGKWYVYYGAYDKIYNDTWHKDEDKCVPALISPDRQTHGIVEFYGKCSHNIYIDAVFPVLHGKNGEDGTVQGLCELAGIPVIGCSSDSSALCMDKYRSHMIAKAAGIDVPESTLITHSMSEDAIAGSIAHMKMPMFVKPLRAGSSLGISKIYSQSEVKSALEKAFDFDTSAVIEECVDGFEIGCAIIGDARLIAGRIDEIEINGDYFDFTEKYTLKNSVIHTPARLSELDEKRAVDTAQRIYRLLGCRIFARVDMFMRRDGKIVFNEVNTIPGFTEHSRFPGMFKATGLSIDDVIQKIIDCSWEG